MNLLALLACITITQQPQPSTANDWALTLTTHVEATAPSPISYTWYEGRKGDTSHPFGWTTSSEFCPAPIPGSGLQCGNSPLFTSVATWVRLTADCGSVDSETAAVTQTHVTSSATEVRVKTSVAPFRPTFAADFSKDGHPDLLLFSRLAREVPVWELLQYSVLSTTEYLDRTTVDPWEVAAVADMDGDSDPDIVLSKRGWGGLGEEPRRVVVWLLDGRHVLSTENFIHYLADRWQVVGAEDFDHDGDADLLLANDTTRENVIWTMNGLTVVDTEHFLPIRTPGWYVVGTGDFDGDGWADILVRSGTNSYNPAGTVVVWRMNGMDVVDTEYFPVSQESFINRRIGGIADFDHDGDDDFVLTDDIQSPFTPNRIVLDVKFP